MGKEVTQRKQCLEEGMAGMNEESVEGVAWQCGQQSRSRHGEDRQAAPRVAAAGLSEVGKTAEG